MTPIRQHWINLGAITPMRDRKMVKVLRLDNVGHTAAAEHIASYFRAPHFFARSKPLSFWEQL